MHYGPEPRAQASGDSPRESPALALRARTAAALLRGFTLLEMLMVIAILGVVAMFVVPNFDRGAEAEHLSESGRRMRSLVTMCRAEAMNQTVRYRVRIRPDGTVRVLRQADALKAPHLYIRPPVDWVQTEILLPDVWVAAIQVLPEGPTPVRIIDDKLEFPETELLPIPVEELERAIDIDFEPDGTTNSLRWVLRDVRGKGLLLTLDGRLGRITTDEWPNVAPEDATRPEAWPEEEAVTYNPEDFQ